MSAFYDFVGPMLGLGAEPKDLTFALLMVLLSSTRSLAGKTAFDAVLIVILASVLSRAINGSASFFASIGASFVLVFLHRFFAWTACRSHAFGKLIKGSALVIVENGKLDRQMMRRNQISEHDLEEDLRLDAKIEELSQVRVARLENAAATSA